MSTPTSSCPRSTRSRPSTTSSPSCRPIPASPTRCGRRSPVVPARCLARMSDIDERIGKMDAMGVDVQVLSASLVHQGLEWADAQTSLRLARITNDWIAKAVAGHPARLIGLGTLPLHVPALAVGRARALPARARPRGGRDLDHRRRTASSATTRCGRSGPRPRRSAPWSTSIPAAIATAVSSVSISGTASARRSRRRWRSPR